MDGSGGVERIYQDFTNEIKELTRAQITINEQENEWW